MPYNTVNPASAPMNCGLHPTETGTCSGLFYKGYIDGMNFRAVSGVVNSPTLITKFLSSSGL